MNLLTSFRFGRSREEHAPKAFSPEHRGQMQRLWNGDRSPIRAVRSDVDPLLARHAPAGPAQDVVAELIGHWKHAFRLPDVASVVRASMSHLNLTNGGLKPSDYLQSLFWTLRHEDDWETCFITSTLLERCGVHDNHHLSSTEFLENVARSYVQNTSYILPLIAAYADSTLAMAEHFKRNRLIFFLRDALFFWPAVAAYRQSPRPVDDFVIYTRPLQRAQFPPILLRDRGDPTSRPVPLDDGLLSDGILLDVGLYGTLVDNLVQQGRMGDGVTVHFLGSRNPHIPGFMNLAGIRKAGNGHSDAKTEDIVRVVDSIECLLKPLLFRGHGEHSEPYARYSDPLSFICATVFVWALFGWCKRNRRGNARNYHLELPTKEAWCIPEPIPMWNGAPDFISHWQAKPEINSASEVEHWFDAWRQT